MNYQRYFYILLLSLFYVTLAQGQVSTIKTTPAHTHQDSDKDHAYHCNVCDTFLFDANKATTINGQLHYHGFATKNHHDHNHTPFYCAGCKGHLGYFNHEDSTYKVINKNLGNEEGSGLTHCLACQTSHFDQKGLISSDESFSIYQQPIDKKTIQLEKRNEFYSVPVPHATCKSCGAVLGEIIPNERPGVGLRINLDAVIKKKGS